MVAGRSFGFINAIDRQPDFKAPALTPPAVNIPHPWTRSVNGLCFLETPKSVMAKRGSAFGPFEGHLVGAEYDTRRLVRMSLQEVDGWVQGAVYPLIHYHPRGGATFLGPLVCSVSPDGDLYVGLVGSLECISPTLTSNVLRIAYGTYPTEHATRNTTGSPALWLPGSVSPRRLRARRRHPRSAPRPNRDSRDPARR